MRGQGPAPGRQVGEELAPRVVPGMGAPQRGRAVGGRGAEIRRQLAPLSLDSEGAHRQRALPRHEAEAEVPVRASPLTGATAAPGRLPAVAAVMDEARDTGRTESAIYGRAGPGSRHPLAAQHLRDGFPGGGWPGEPPWSSSIARPRRKLCAPRTLQPRTLPSRRPRRRGRGGSGRGRRSGGRLARAREGVQPLVLPLPVDRARRGGARASRARRESGAARARRSSGHRGELSGGRAAPDLLRGTGGAQAERHGERPAPDHGQAEASARPGASISAPGRGECPRWVTAGSASVGARGRQDDGLAGPGAGSGRPAPCRSSSRRSRGRPCRGAPCHARDSAGSTTASPI